MQQDLPDETLARVLRTVERGRRAYRHYLGIIKAQRCAMSEGRWAQLPILQSRVSEVQGVVAEMVRTLTPVRARIEAQRLSGPNVARLNAATAGAVREAALVSHHLSDLMTHASTVRDRTGAQLGRTAEAAGPTRTPPGHRAYTSAPTPDHVLDRAG
jgi:hypothetical protein